MLTLSKDSPRAQSTIAENADQKAMERHFTRDWRIGDVYAPHDLSAAEARKWRKKVAPTTDAFDVLSKNPLTLYKVCLVHGRSIAY